MEGGTLVVTRILEICGSPRRAGTYNMLLEAAEGAKAVPGTEVELIELRKLDIRPCKGCMRCSEDGADPLRPCLSNDDDFGADLAQKLIRADGLIVGSPVYYGTVSGQLKTFMDRTEPLLRYSKSSLRCGLRSKVGGAVAVGSNRHGGEETTIIAIVHWMLIHDMIVVGTSTEDHPGCYMGAAGSHYPKYQRTANAIREDALGLKAARALGRRVAEVASWIAAGRGGAAR